MVEIKSMDRIVDHYSTAMTRAIETEEAGRENPEFEEHEQIDSRQAGLSYPKRNWSDAIDEHARNAFQGEMNRATSDARPDQEGTQTVWQGAIEDTDNAVFLDIMQTRGVDNYRTVMTSPEPLAHYDTAIASMKTVLDNIRIAPYDPSENWRAMDDSILANINNRCMPVAQTLHAWSIGQENLEQYYGPGPITVTSPAVAHWAHEFGKEMTEQRAVRRFQEAWQDGPDWQGRTVANADNWVDGCTPVNQLAASWFVATGAVSQEDWFARTARGNAVDKWRNCFEAAALPTTVNRFRRGFSPFHETLANLDLDTYAPRHPKGADENRWRVAYTAVTLAYKKQQINGATVGVIQNVDFGRAHEAWEDFVGFLRGLF